MVSNLDKSARSSELLVLSFSSLRLSSDEDPPADQRQGHKSKATIVIVVSKQFDKVLVEQNHCQGFKTVTSNYNREPSLANEQLVLFFYRPRKDLPCAEVRAEVSERKRHTVAQDPRESFP